MAKSLIHNSNRNQNRIDSLKILEPRYSAVYNRERLYGLLDEYRNTPVIWITGPPGSGKSTLASSYLSSRALPHTWYSIDQGDEDIASFFHYMGLALDNNLSDTKKTLPLLTPEYLASIPVFSKRYFEKIFTVVKRPFVMVFDDYHELSRASFFHQIIREGFSVVPEGINVIITSRSEPPPDLSRLLAKQIMKIVDWQDLQFRSDESLEVMKLYGLDSIFNDKTEQIIKNNDGWVAGLVLLQQGRNVKKLTPDFLLEQGRDKIFDYFAGEFFNHEDQQARDFLLTTAFLEQIPISVAKRLSGNKYAEDILARMHRSHFFTEKLFLEKPVYKYHPLFRDFLRNRAGQLISEKGIHQIKFKAAKILEEEGAFKEAAILYSEIWKHEELAALILKQAHIMFSQGRIGTLLRWLEYLPESAYTENPYLLYWKGLCQQPFSQAESLACLEKSFKEFEKNEDLSGTLLSWSAIVSTYVFEWNDFTKLDKWIDWFEENCPVDNTSPSLHIAMSMMQALMTRRPQHPEIERWISIVLKLAKRYEDNNIVVQALSYVINFYIWIGKYHKVETIMADLQKLAKPPGASSLTLLTYNWLNVGMCFWTRRFMREKAIELVDDSLNLAQKTGVHVWDHMLYALMIDGAINEGNFKQAEIYLKKMENTLHPSRRHGYCHYHYLQAWKYFRQNNLDKAEMHSQTAVEVGRETGYVFPVILCLLEAANIYCGQKKHEKAKTFLKEAEKLNYPIQSGIFKFMALVTETKILYGQGEKRQGDLRLKKTFSLARKQQYYSMLWWCDPVGIGKLCVRALQNNVEVYHVREMIKNMDLFPVEPLNYNENWPWYIKIHTLKSFQIIINDAPLQYSGKAQKKPLEMLKLLIAAGAKDVRSEHIMNHLWPDADGDLAYQSFTTTLYRLRKIFGKDEIVQLNQGRISLNDRYCWLDIWAYEKKAQVADKEWQNSNDDQEEAAQLSETVVSMYKNNFLQDDSEHFTVLSTRERLSDIFIKNILRLGGYLQEKKKYWDAIKNYRRGLEINDLEEVLYQRIMDCYLKLDRKTDAIQYYNRCKEVLNKELVLEPSKKTELLKQEIIKN